MNCERFKENLHEYVDDALAPPEKAAAQSHLGECSACRELVQNEWLIGQVLSGRLKEAVETVTLDAPTRQSMAAAVRKQFQNVPEPKKIFSFPSWLRLVIPAAAAALIAAIWFRHSLVSDGNLAESQPPAKTRIGDQESQLPTASSPSPPRSGGEGRGEVVLRAHGENNSSSPEVPVHVSWSAPRYTFRQEGAMVIDALISDTRVADATLLAKKQTKPNLYDH